MNNALIHKLIAELGVSNINCLVFYLQWDDIIKECQKIHRFTDDIIPLQFTVKNLVNMVHWLLKIRSFTNQYGLLTLT